MESTFCRCSPLRCFKAVRRAMATGLSARNRALPRRHVPLDSRKLCRPAHLRDKACRSVACVRTACAQGLRQFRLRHDLADTVQQVRLEVAARMLRAPSAPPLTVAQIAYRCGFSDPAYFGFVFRKQYGCTPGETCTRSSRPNESRGLMPRTVSGSRASARRKCKARLASDCRSIPVVANIAALRDGGPAQKTAPALIVAGCSGIPLS